MQRLLYQRHQESVLGTTPSPRRAIDQGVLDRRHLHRPEQHRRAQSPGEAYEGYLQPIGSNGDLARERKLFLPTRRQGSSAPGPEVT
jgi:hypothetical protein